MLSSCQFSILASDHRAEQATSLIQGVIGDFRRGSLNRLVSLWPGESVSRRGLKNLQIFDADKSLQQEGEQKKQKNEKELNGEFSSTKKC